VRQRQPDGANLIVAGSLGIDNATGNIQVAFGVAIIEEPAVRRGNPDSGEVEYDQESKRETQNAVQVLNSR